MTRSSIHGDSVFTRIFIKLRKDNNRMYYNPLYGGLISASLPRIWYRRSPILSGQYYYLTATPLIFDMKIVRLKISRLNIIGVKAWYMDFLYIERKKYTLLERYKDGVLISSDQNVKPVNTISCAGYAMPALCTIIGIFIHSKINSWKVASIYSSNSATLLKFVKHQSIIIINVTCNFGVFIKSMLGSLDHPIYLW